MIEAFFVVGIIQIQTMSAHFSFSVGTELCLPLQKVNICQDIHDSWTKKHVNLNTLAAFLLLFINSVIKLLQMTKSLYFKLIFN